MHLYLGAGEIDIPGGVYSDFVNYWYDQGAAITGDRSKSELRTIAEMVLPAYIWGVSRGECPELDLVSGGGGYLASANRELAEYMDARTGLTQDTWVTPLMVLDDAIELGAVPAWLMEPQTWGDVAPPSIIDKLTPAGDWVGKEIGSTITKGLITAGFAIVAVILGKAVIDKAI